MAGHKRIVLVGPAATGKDFIKKKFRQVGFIPDVSYTTRKPREGETHGVEYNFISEDEFTLRISQDAFYEYARHGDYLYGTGRYEWNNADVFIMEAHGVSLITKEDRENCLVIYVNTPFDTRLERMRGRGWDAANISHRTTMDFEKFKDFKDFDLEIIS